MIIKLKFSHNDYCSVLHTIDFILDNEIPNPYDDNIDLVDLKNNLMTYSFIKSTEKDEDIIRSSLTEAEMKMFYFLLGFGKGVNKDNPKIKNIDNYMIYLYNKLNDYESENK